MIKFEIIPKDLILRDKIHHNKYKKKNYIQNSSSKIKYYKGPKYFRTNHRM